MRIWIDATQPESLLRVFGMTQIERHLTRIVVMEAHLKEIEHAESLLGGMVRAEGKLRRVAEIHMRPTEVVIELPPDAPIPTSIPQRLLAKLPIRWMRNPASVRERLQRMLKEADGEPVLAFAGDSEIDVRVLEQLAWLDGESVAFLSGEKTEACAAMRLEKPLAHDSGDEIDLLAIARVELKLEHIKEITVEDFDCYISKLRRSLPPYMFKVHDQSSRQRTERFLFHSNYKGSTDFLTKYVYPPLVWWLLKPLTKWRVHPNVVTGASIAFTFASVPFFAAGMWVPGLVLAYLMSVLDSVDGKLARVTFTSSTQGDVLDHGLDIIHPPFWYWSWAWGLSGGDPFSGVFIASLWMAALYIIDRVMEALFKSCTGKSIHGYRPLDVKMRTFISRRNVNLAIFTVALPMGLGVEAFFLIVGWQAFTLLFHLSRVVTFWNK